MDEFFRAKAGKAQYPFKEEYWEAAEALIEADQRRLAALWWRWALAALAMLVLSAAGAWGWYQHTQASHPELWATPAASTFWLPDTCGQPAEERVWKREEPGQARTPTLATSASSTAGPRELQNQTKRRRERSAAVSSGEWYAALAQPATQQDEQVLTEIELAALRARSYRLRLPWQAEAPLFPSSLPNRQRHHLSVLAGQQLSPAWDADDPQRPSIAPVAGLRYRYEWTPRVQLQAGISYEQRGQLNRDTTFTSVEFGFGRNTSSVRLVTRRLHFLALPLALQLRLASRHHLFLGVAPVWLAGIRTEVQEGEQRQQSFRYPQGYRRWDLALQVGYEYSLAPGWHLNLQADAGLRDLTDDAYFQAGRMDRNINARIQLVYDLW